MNDNKLNATKQYRSTAYLLIRLLLGSSMLGHGLVRLPKLAAFSDHIVTSFKQSILPDFLTVPFSYAIPFWEFVVGILLIIGLFTKEALIACTLLMIFLILGSTLIENWSVIDSQLLHGLISSGLLASISYNSYSSDNRWRKR